jgi:hypothetical protein
MKKTNHRQSNSIHFLDIFLKIHSNRLSLCCFKKDNPLKVFQTDFYLEQLKIFFIQILFPLIVSLLKTESEYNQPQP